ncbi:MAG: DUF3836 domain-containing protein [Bacteroidales bacterium]
MKSITIKSVFISLFMILGLSMVSAQEDSKFVYDCKYENDKIVSKTIFEKDSDSQALKQIAKYEYAYDSKGRIVEKVAYRWNTEKRNWENHFKMICQYNESDATVTIDYGTWDKNKKDYTQNQQHTVYAESDMEKIIS